MKYTLTDIFQGEAPVSQYYGVNSDYYKQFGLAGHEGVDFACKPGTPILAPFDGIILRDADGWNMDRDYGDFIVIWDPVQLCAVWMCHLTENYVNLGQAYKRGTVLGKTGNTGNSSGPHLHINFVQTDKQGNRLNLNNGYQGFLNVLDEDMIMWKLGGVAPSADNQIGKARDLVSQLRTAVRSALDVGDPEAARKMQDIKQQCVEVMNLL